jgi:formylglycine-generating enzyme required for sulfatase activity
VGQNVFIKQLESKVQNSWIPADFVNVPAGPFVYGPEVTFERREQMPPPRLRQIIDLDAFWIGKYPVTYRQWKAFLDEKAYPWRGQWYVIRRGWRSFGRKYAPGEAYPPDLADYPIVDVTLAEALAYCDWLSDRLGLNCTLPNEFQWEKAARGTDGRTYPWGETPPRPELGRLRATHRLGLDYLLSNLFVRGRSELARSGWYWRIGTPWPVGMVPENISPHGCFDMAGNIWEWTISLYNEDLPNFHVVKGGSWGYSPHHTSCNCRSVCSLTTPSVDYHAQGTGFRVAILPNR